jgi:diacylglycerol kinase family enzyme
LYKEFTPERIIVAGGDGTIKLVASKSEDFVLGILAGSSNGLARDGLPKAIEENLPIAFHNNYLEMDMIVVNGKSLHLSDLGLNATLIKNYHEGSMHGRWALRFTGFQDIN